MSTTIATYSFLSWMRQGLSGNIVEADNDPSVKLRASIRVKLFVDGLKKDGVTVEHKELPEKTVHLYGPGDIVGIDAKAIIKTEPRNWITNFEPNYLAYIDFYEEDFPWRYTPARATADRLRPWITLVVLKDDEFTDGKDVRNKPLPSFVLKSGKKTSDIFPVATDLWAWSHVHVNTDLSEAAAPNAADPVKVAGEMSITLRSNPDLAYSRILCPRKLEPNIGYHAFLIPSFESGRLAGLGVEIPDALVASTSAWANEGINEFPYYHRWYFRTGVVGDFEYLVNLLKPKPADKSVGVRDMDVGHPGSNLPPIDYIIPKNLLKLGGALRVPLDSMNPQDKAEAIKFDNWEDKARAENFASAMARRINLADDYLNKARQLEDVNKDAGILNPDDNNTGDQDPVITSPLYGRWQALQQRLMNDRQDAALPHKENWIHELNLDPRFRVAAGLGTKVVQQGQETYMQAAWEQIGKIIETNNRFRFGQMAVAVSEKFFRKHLLPLSSGKAFLFTGPLHKRIIYEKETTHGFLSASRIPVVMSSGTFRTMARPRGPMLKRIGFDNIITPYNLVDRVNNGEVVVTPPKKDPDGGITLQQLEDAVSNNNQVPPVVKNLLEKNGWLRFLPLILLLLLILIILLFFRNTIGFSFLAIVSATMLALFNQLNKWYKKIQFTRAVGQDAQTPVAVDAFPSSPNFVISTPTSGFSPARGAGNSAEAVAFKTALKDAFLLTSTEFPEIERKQIPLDKLTENLVAALQPAVTIPRRLARGISIPGYLANNQLEWFSPVMAHPEIDLPMYKPLADLSSEYFLPNINKIEQNSITLLENNQKFIESYMVGLNHEMSRELLWREYPTDQRGTYFRQFWDVTSFLPPKPIPPDIKESLRDIPKIHFWSKTDETPVSSAVGAPKKNALGQHNLRAIASGKTQLVLVIRGELLKKYPTAVVYAHKADWGPDQTVVNGQQPKPKSVSEERIFATLTPAEELDPPPSKIKTPLFEAKIDPDIYFFGFDLDDEEARGTLDPKLLTDDPGWFFVIKERPGEPRFGLDINKARNEAGTARMISWNNLSWEDVETPDGKCIQLNKTITKDTYAATLDQENRDMLDDVQARWSPDTNAAELAYILYQVPVLVGVHASRMLPKK